MHGRDADVIDLATWRRRRARPPRLMRVPPYWCWTIVWVRLW